VTLLEQHLQLQARLKVSVSAVTHYRNQLLVYRHTAGLLAPCQAQLQEAQAKYEKLAEQVSREDPLLKGLYCNDYGHPYVHQYLDYEELRELRPHLWLDD
jgi:hypothetical protein